MGTQSGFRIYQSDPLMLQLSRELHGGIGKIEMLYRQNIMALVGGGANPKWPKSKVIMWDDLQVEMFEELNHNQEVQGVRMRQEVTIVLITNRIYLYGIPEFAIIGQIDTTQGSRPTIGLSQAENNFVLALPGVEVGTIVLKTSLDSGV